jgi:Protein of unknown function (DUF998)
VARGIALVPETQNVVTKLPVSTRRTSVRTLLLTCGILSSLLYTAMLVFVPLQWAAYSSFSQTISELSAIDAPTRPLWMALGIFWTSLYVAFGLGVWMAAGETRRLRIVGAIMIGQGIVGLFWPPMHLRGTSVTMTDTLHIAWTMVNGMLTMLAMGFGAAALRKPFRRYSITTMVVLVAAGAATGRYASRIPADLPTPWAGVWERINLTAFLLWVVVLAIALLRRPHTEVSIS